MLAMPTASDRRAPSRFAQNDRFGAVRSNANGMSGCWTGEGVAGEEGVEAAETGVEFGCGEAAIAVEAGSNSSGISYFTAARSARAAGVSFAAAV